MEKMDDRKELLQYPISKEVAIKLQHKWIELISQEKAPAIHVDDINTVVGVDVTYLKNGSDEYGIACAVLWDIHAKIENQHEFAVEKVEFAYISGLLAFREIRVASMAIKKLSRSSDVILYDGHGVSHPRRFGAAVTIGVALNIPSIGVAKRPLVGGWNWKEMRRKAGERASIIDNGEKIGYVMVLLDNLSPVFVSAGYKTDLDTAAEIALKTTLRHKQPECITRAHQYLQNHRTTLLNSYMSR